MLSTHLKDTVKLEDSVSSWEDSIKVAAAPLLEKGNINESYIEKMINNVHEFGPYIVIVPGVAMPHAQNEGEVNSTGVSLLKLEKPVLYPEDKEVSLILVLAATDSDGHLDLISTLAEVLSEEDTKEGLENAKNKEEILNLIQSAE